MINELLKPLFLETKLIKPSDGELLLTLRGGKGFLLFSLVFIGLLLLFMNFCFEKYAITCKNKSENSANECVLHVNHFFFSEKKTIYLGRLKEAKKEFYGLRYKSGNLSRTYNIILDTDSGVIPLFSEQRTESISTYVPAPDISTKINSYINQSTNNQLNINDPDRWFIYFIYSVITFLGFLSLYNVLFLNRISILLNKNTSSVTVQIKNSLRTKESNHPLSDVEQFIVQKKGEHLIYKTLRLFLKSEDDKPTDVSKLEYKSFKMKRMLDKTQSGGDEYNWNKGYQFAVYMVLKTEHLIQLTSFHYVNRKELFKAIEAFNQFLT